MAVKTKLGYSVYENKNVDSVVIHKTSCRTYKLHGGKHAWGQGGWADCATLEEAEKLWGSVTRKFKKRCGICKV